MKRIRILLVEDEPVILKLTSEILSRNLGERADIKIAKSYEEAISFIKSTAALDFLITDWGLSGAGDGIDVIKNALEKFPDLKIVAMTADLAENFKKATVARLDEERMEKIKFLQKPFRPKVLLSLFS